MWHVSFRSGVATLRTAIRLLLTYLLPLPTPHSLRRLNPSALDLGTYGASSTLLAAYTHLYL